MKNTSQGILLTFAAFMITAGQAFANEGLTFSSDSTPESLMPFTAEDEAYVRKWESFLSDYQRMVNAAQNDQSHKPFTLDQVRLVAPEKLPKSGTFWSLQGRPPLPFNLFDNTYTNIQVNIYALPNGVFVMDDADVDYDALRKEKLAALRSAKGTKNGIFDLEEDSGSSGMSMLRTAEQFLAQTFLVIDTNAAATIDSNLYNACISFPADTNTAASLQIAKYGANAVIIKANHFDYSAETERDFALLVCDSVEKPLWKNIDLLGASDSQDGWLVQGSVPNWKVTDPMFLLVSNITKADNAFFRAIPYGGPIVQLTGPQPYDIVSNTITLHAIVSDLSGVTNVQFELTVDGDLARYSFGTNNTISLNTKYNPNGMANIYLKAFSQPRIYDTANPPDNSKLFFSGLGVLPLDFESDTYLLWASDYCSLDVGTNYFYYVTDRPQTITASIYDPADGHVVKSFGGYVPIPATISLSWNFTDADGVTPYSNDTYAVTFQTSNPTTITYTNKIDREGVRTGAGCFLTYQEEDPNDLIYGPGNSYLNDQANARIKGDLKTLYKDLYKSFSLTQYTTSQVGTNRNHSDCVAQDPTHLEWAEFLQPALSNSIYSDFTLAQAHGNGSAIGGGPFLLNRFTPSDLQGWLRPYGENWRMRKVAIWTCYSGNPLRDPRSGAPNPLTFPDACGIRPINLQLKSFSRKNCGLFFGGLIDQAWVTDGELITTARAAAFLDQAWVCGKNQWPGACDPTYSFDWAIRATLGQYPEMNPNNQAEPRRYGYPNMIYSSLYDDELMFLDNTHVKNN